MTAENIHEWMEVLDCSGAYMGVVESIEGQTIKLRNGFFEDAPHLLPLEWVDRVDQRVHLNKTSVQVYDAWEVVATMTGG